MWERPDPTFKVVPGTLFQSWMLTLSFPKFFVFASSVSFGGEKQKSRIEATLKWGFRGAIPDPTNFEIGLQGPILIYSSFFSGEWSS